MRVSANGIEFSVEIEGEGPSVTLIHGMASGLESWDAVVARLRPHYRVMRFDLRGHGDSQRVPGPYQITDFAKDLRALLDALDIEKTHLAGFSLGGLIAQSFALDHADRLDRLAIISAVANKSPEVLARLKARADKIDAEGRGEVMDAALERWFTPEFRAAHPDLVANRVKRYLATDDQTFAAAYRTFVEGDLGDQLHRIKTPTLVMTGEYDPGSSAEMARFMHAQIQGSKLHIIPRLRHSLMVEGPDIVADQLLAFFGADA